MSYHYRINFIEFSYNCNMDFIEQSSNYLFKASNKNTRASYEICSQLETKIPEQYQYCPSHITVKFKHVTQIRLVSLLLYLWL